MKMKLLDYALCDDDTVKRAAVRIHDLPTEVLPAVRARCDGRPHDIECGAPGEKPYTTSDGETSWLCALHYYQLKCIENWDAIRRQMTRQQEGAS